MKWNEIYNCLNHEKNNNRDNFYVLSEVIFNFNLIVVLVYFFLLPCLNGPLNNQHAQNNF